MSCPEVLVEATCSTADTTRVEDLNKTEDVSVRPVFTPPVALLDQEDAPRSNCIVDNLYGLWHHLRNAFDVIRCHRRTLGWHFSVGLIHVCILGLSTAVNVTAAFWGFQSKQDKLREFTRNATDDGFPWGKFFQSMEVKLFGGIIIMIYSLVILFWTAVGLPPFVSFMKRCFRKTWFYRHSNCCKKCVDDCNFEDITRYFDGRNQEQCPRRDIGGFLDDLLSEVPDRESTSPTQIETPNQETDSVALAEVHQLQGAPSTGETSQPSADDIEMMPITTPKSESKSGKDIESELL